MLLSGCSNTPHTLKTRLVYEPVPTVLTRQTPVPALEIPVTWYRVTEWSDRLLEALDTCNADKAAIAWLDKQRAERAQDAPHQE
ncbi:peptidase [Escherichia coli]|nr:peptidase [Escherichia coli]